MTEQNFITNMRESIANFIFPEGEERREHLSRAANTDSLTGLANRNYFDQCLSNAERDKTKSLILFDVNNFKKVNTYYGQERGDQVLAQVADIIRQICNNYKSQSKPFRLGGDEFIIIADNDVAFQIRNDIEMTMGDIWFRGPNHHFIISISGVVAETYSQSCEILQTRKSQRKEEMIIPV